MEKDNKEKIVSDIESWLKVNDPNLLDKIRTDLVTSANTLYKLAQKEDSAKFINDYVITSNVYILYYLHNIVSRFDVDFMAKTKEIEATKKVNDAEKDVVAK